MAEKLSESSVRRRNFNVLWSFLFRKLELGKFKLQVSFPLGSFVSDENIWNALSLSFKYLGVSWLQAKSQQIYKYCCFGPFSGAHEVCLLTPSKIPIEKTSWTLGNLYMSISPQWKEVEKMLIHHFGSETQGFQGLVNQNYPGKA